MGHRGSCGGGSGRSRRLRRRRTSRSTRSRIGRSLARRRRRDILLIDRLAFRRDGLAIGARRWPLVALGPVGQKPLGELRAGDGPVIGIRLRLMVGRARRRLLPAGRRLLLLLRPVCVSLFALELAWLTIQKRLGLCVLKNYPFAGK